MGNISVKTHQPPSRAVIDCVDRVVLLSVNAVGYVFDIHLQVPGQWPSVTLVMTFVKFLPVRLTD